MSEYDLQQQAARRYIAEHHVQELLAHLLQLVAYHRPEDPKKFMREELAKIRENKGTPSELFTAEDLQTMFDMVDVTRQRSITKQQLKNACKNVSSASAQQTDGESIEKAVNAISGEKVGPSEFAEVLGGQLRTPNFWSQ